MNKLTSSVLSFVHSITTNDRYASYNSQHKNVNPRSKYSRHNNLNDDSSGLVSGSIYPDDNGSGNSVSSPYIYSANSSRQGSSTNLNNSSRIPYAPGMRSTQLGNGGILLQDYAEGLPPPPSCTVSWSRIDRWVEAHYPELYDQLSYPATSADLNELESDLDCSLPLDVRDSYLIHDGQEHGGIPTGLIYGITLLDLEDISEEWSHWKNTAIRLNARIASKAPNREGTSHAASRASLSWLDHQQSVPDSAIQLVYSHPGWIPLAKDPYGNNIAIDLAPGPAGRWGQVILFGRDFDRKYVVASSWAAFISTFADDLENGNHYIDEDVENAELSFQTADGRLVSYFDVLKSRVERSLPRAPVTSKPKSTSSTRASSPAMGSRTIVPPRTRPDKLISPMASATNLPTTSLSRVSSQGSNGPAIDSNAATTPTTSKPPAAATEAPKQIPKSEVDVLKEELSEVEI